MILKWSSYILTIIINWVSLILGWSFTVIYVFVTIQSLGFSNISLQGFIIQEENSVVSQALEWDKIGLPGEWSICRL